MEVHVKLFATLRRHYPEMEIGEAMPVELAEGATVDQLLASMDLPTDQVKVVFVNGVVQPGDHVLQADDVVGLFPPVGGG
ncbi:MAG TPA: MoaD/ThiS family protein [Chloroflexi bacterium]|nr:MoaD/ThiS family protein [Chloroflexota bacterium]